MTESRRPPPPLLVERYLLDVLTESERAELHKLCSEEELLRLRAEHRALQESCIAALPPAHFADLVRARAQRQSTAQAPKAAPARRAAPVLAFAALLAVLAFVSKDGLERLATGPGASAGSEGAEPGERSKGLAPSLRVYRKRVDTPELLAYGAGARRGDLLQLGYLAPGMSHAVLLSIDGRGQVTLHFPATEGADTRLPPHQGEQLLQAAYELDDAPGFERFVLVSAARALRAADVVRVARQVAERGEQARELPLPLPANVAQTSLLLRKVEP